MSSTTSHQPSRSRRPFGARLADAMDDQGPLCVGIDPHPSLLEAWGLTDSAAGLRDFALRTVDAVGGRVAAVKPQSAFFERHGSAGIAVLEETLAALRDVGTLSVLDVKRGDIGSTMAGYARPTCPTARPWPPTPSRSRPTWAMAPSPPHLTWQRREGGASSSWL